MRKINKIVYTLILVSIVTISINSCKKTSELSSNENSNNEIVNNLKRIFKDEKPSFNIPNHQKIDIGYLGQDGITRSLQELRNAQSRSSFSPYCDDMGGSNGDQGVESYGYFESITRTNFVCGFNAPGTAVNLIFKYRISTSENLNSTGPTRLRIKGRNYGNTAYTFTTQSTTPNTPGIPIINQVGATVVFTGEVDVNSPNYPDNYWWDVCYTISMPNSVFSTTESYICNPILGTDCPNYSLVLGLASTNYSIFLGNVFSDVCLRNDKVWINGGNLSANALPAVGGTTAITDCSSFYGYINPGSHHVKIYEGTVFKGELYVPNFDVRTINFLQPGHTYRYEYRNVKYNTFNPANLLSGISCETATPTVEFSTYTP